MAFFTDTFLKARREELLRAVSRTGSRRRAEESREGEKSPAPAERKM